MFNKIYYYKTVFHGGPHNIEAARPWSGWRLFYWFTQQS